MHACGAAERHIRFNAVFKLYLCYLSACQGMLFEKSHQSALDVLFTKDAFTKDTSSGCIPVHKRVAVPSTP